MPTKGGFKSSRRKPVVKGAFSGVKATGENSRQAMISRMFKSQDLHKALDRHLSDSLNQAHDNAMKFLSSNKPEPTGELKELRRADAPKPSIGVTDESEARYRESVRKSKLPAPPVAPRRMGGESQ